MEANEAQELQEHAEHSAHEPSMRPVAFTMSVLAVLVAVVTLLGHRTHTEAILAQTRAAVEQNRASDMWSYYQAKNIRNTATGLANDELSVAQLADKKGADRLREQYEKKLGKWEEDLKETQAQAQETEAKVKEKEKEVTVAEKRANWLDLAEALLEIGLVVSSVTLLTQKRVYWYAGLVASLAGIASTVAAYLLH